MTSYAFKDNKKTDQSENETDPGTSSYEVFRNNTTAVEVIIKDVFNKNKKRVHADVSDLKLNRLQNEVDALKNELDNSNKLLAKTRRGFQTIVREMRKQIDTANLRESDTLARNLSLKLENEKLRLLLDSKTKLTAKLKKEFLSLKRVLKFVMKSVSNTPEVPENVSLVSDPEYDDFEMDLKKNVRVRFLDKNVNGTDTLDSFDTFSKEFDKKV